MSLLTHSVVKPAWNPIEQPMTTDLRLFGLDHQDIGRVREIMRQFRMCRPYSPLNDDHLDVIEAKMDLGPTHRHVQRGTQLRLIGLTRRKNDDNTLAIYETPCRIVYVMPQAEFSDKTISL